MRKGWKGRTSSRLLIASSFMAVPPGHQPRPVAGRPAARSSMCTPGQYPVRPRGVSSGNGCRRTIGISVLYSCTRVFPRGVSGDAAPGNTGVRSRLPDRGQGSRSGGSAARSARLEPAGRCSCFGADGCPRLREEHAAGSDSAGAQGPCGDAQSGRHAAVPCTATLSAAIPCGQRGR